VKKYFIKKENNLAVKNKEASAIRKSDQEKMHMNMTLYRKIKFAVRKKMFKFFRLSTNVAKKHYSIIEKVYLIFPFIDLFMSILLKILILNKFLLIFLVF